MNPKIVLRLETNLDRFASLERLQAVFAAACTALGPIVKETRCWNRVALHHLSYRILRERFPDLGSQMICNAIYSVSRTARLIFQNRASPWSIEKYPERPLPVLQFTSTAPVYFDRHTLSLKGAQLSMYTLDGRMRFDVSLNSVDANRFRYEKLKEIILSRDSQGYFLVFTFAGLEEKAIDSSDLPEHVLVLEAEVLSA